MLPCHSLFFVKIPWSIKGLLTAHVFLYADCFFFIKFVRGKYEDFSKLIVKWEERCHPSCLCTVNLLMLRHVF